MSESNHFDDISKLKLPVSELEENQKKLEARKKAKKELLPPRHKKGEKFISGLIPLSWVKEMLKLPTSASQLSWILWHLAGMKKARVIDVNLSSLEEFNIPRTTAWRSIGYLEKAGLISVVHNPGRKLRVILLDVTSLDEETSGGTN